MVKCRKHINFWRRNPPRKALDIAELRPAYLKKKRRFETIEDSCAESIRSEALLRTRKTDFSWPAEMLHECRNNLHHCDCAYCPLCARSFRRWLIGQLLRLTQSQTVHIMTVLLEAAECAKLDDLDPRPYRHSLRKRLERAGFETPIIGGYEVVYRAADNRWILHVNLVILNGCHNAMRKFKHGFSSSELHRPVETVMLQDPSEQLSYVLKFTTYHRPFKRIGPGKPRAVPLNRREHRQLVQWMAQFEFSDFLFLYNARRHGEMIVTASHS
jgi:hypothetical protein